MEAATTRQNVNTNSVTSELRPDMTPVERYAVYSELRNRDPISWQPEMRAWIITNYADVKLLLSDMRLSARPQLVREERLQDPQIRAVFKAVHAFFETWVLFSDTELHARRRDTLQPHFRATTVESFRRPFKEMAQRLATSITNDDFDDIFGRFIRPYAIESTCAVLGVTLEEQPRVIGWIEEILAYLTLGHTDENARNAVKASEALGAYIVGILLPRSNVGITATLNVALNSGHLAKLDIVGMLAQLLAAGIEPVSSAMATAVINIKALFTDKAQGRRYSKAALRNLIRESLRYDAPFHMASRIALQPLTLLGTNVLKGDPVKLVIASANHDPNVFPDPEKFDPTRKNLASALSFGRGLHFCLGSDLSFVQMEEGLGALLRRAPNLSVSKVERFPSWSATRFKSLGCNQF